MKIVSLEAKNFRGLRELKLSPGGENLVIYGPNGSGKSSVVDAIDFLFTGRIARLEGQGTADISLNRHGPHIHHGREAALVTAAVKLPGVKQVVRITRHMAAPGILEYPPEAEAALAGVSSIVERGGVVLTRRDILRYITARAGDRAKQVQELLNLDEVEAVRKGLVGANNKLREAGNAADRAVRTAEAELIAVLGLPSYSPEQVLEKINESRQALGGNPLSENDSSRIKDSLVNPSIPEAGRPAVDFAALQQNINDLRDIIRPKAAESRLKAAAALRENLDELRANAEWLDELQLLDLRKQAQTVVADSTTECPVCGAAQSAAHIRRHLAVKIQAAEDLEKSRNAIAQAAETLARPARNAQAKLEAVINSAAAGLGDAAGLAEATSSLSAWLTALGGLITMLANPLEMPESSARPEPEIARLFVPSEGETALNAVETAAEASVSIPSPEQAAWDRLNRLEVGVRSLENRIAEQAAAERNRAKAAALLDEYNKQRNAVLDGLYKRIAGRFEELYGLLHNHESGTFTAQLQPKRAGLDLQVDYLGRGQPPPQALHSEGHQDSMGLCLFLALGEELTAPQVGLVVLDDVVMSVDAEHRKEICRLIREQFPTRQFIITTHDQVWAKQLRYQRVVEPRQVVQLRGWTLLEGPRVGGYVDLWDAIQRDIDDGKINDAAAKLRRNSEEFFEGACDALAATITYNSGHQWDLGQWLSAAQSRYTQLLKAAQSSARSWGNQETLSQLDELDSVRGQVFNQAGVEQWAVNAAVHYNEWANLGPSDFASVAAAFKDLYDLFKCFQCGQFIEVQPATREPRSVKCRCGKVNWNLERRKGQGAG